MGLGLTYLLSDDKLLILGIPNRGQRVNGTRDGGGVNLHVDPHDESDHP